MYTCKENASYVANTRFSHITQSKIKKKIHILDHSALLVSKSPTLKLKDKSIRCNCSPPHLNYALSSMHQENMHRKGKQWGESFKTKGEYSAGCIFELPLKHMMHKRFYLTEKEKLIVTVLAWFFVTRVVSCRYSAVCGIRVVNYSVLRLLEFFRLF